MKYLVIIPEVHLSHRIVDATSIDEALDKAANNSKSQIYLEYSTMLDKEKWGVQVDTRTVEQIDDATTAAMRWRYNHDSGKK